ncbi:MAG: hypothetical protein ABIB93_07640 [Chloroflexota bacterium]
MIERVHEHIIAELNQNTKTDIIFVIVAILLNLITLAVNSAVASGQALRFMIVMFIFVSLVIVVNFVVVTGLVKGRETRQKLITGLLQMYKDQGVDGYYDPSLLGNYNTRYNLFILAVVFTGLIAIVIPFIVR